MAAPPPLSHYTNCIHIFTAGNYILVIELNYVEYYVKHILNINIGLYLNMYDKRSRRRRPSLKYFIRHILLYTSK